MTLKAKERIEKHTEHCEKALARVFAREDHYSIFYATYLFGFYVDCISSELLTDGITFEEYLELRNFFEVKTSEILSVALKLDRKE